MKATEETLEVKEKVAFCISRVASTTEYVASLHILPLFCLQWNIEMKNESLYEHYCDECIYIYINLCFSLALMYELSNL